MGYRCFPRPHPLRGPIEVHLVSVRHRASSVSAPGPSLTTSNSRSLVTLAVQNSLLTIVMHYSRVHIPPSQSYSAPTAVLLNELLKGAISLAIAFSRIDRSPPYASDLPQPGLTSGRFWHSSRLLLRIRKLAREVFSPDCWKLSIPAILYGASSSPPEKCSPSLITHSSHSEQFAVCGSDQFGSSDLPS